MNLTPIEEMIPSTKYLRSEALRVENPAISGLVLRYQKIFEISGGDANLPLEHYRKIYEKLALQDEYSHVKFLNTLKELDRVFLNELGEHDLLGLGADS